MKSKWFKRLGWLYRPVAVPGIIITLSAVAFCAQVFLAIDRRSRSASDTLFGIFPYFVCCFLLFDWIARKTSDETQ